MATVIELSADGGPLIKLDPMLEEREQEWRWIYILTRIKSRFEIDLHAMTSVWKVEESCAQQMDVLLETFCSGETLTFDQRFKPLNHLGEGIWELKTPDLRLFGWFPYRECFVCGALDTATNVKSHNLYAGYCNTVKYFRDQLNLDNPKFVPGENPRDVIANYDYP
jgi:hypothetical protein